MKYDIEESRAYVLQEAKANVLFVREHPRNVKQAQQVNGALANIVAMERNMVMQRAVDRAIENDRFINGGGEKVVQGLPKSSLGPEGQGIPQPVPQVLGSYPAGKMVEKTRRGAGRKPGHVSQTRLQAKAGVRNS